MKTRFLIVLAGCLVATAGFAENLLTNPGFEDAGGWGVWGGARETWYPRTGSWSAYIGGWSAWNGGFCQDVAVTSTGTYTFAIWLRQSTNFNPYQTYLDLKFEFLCGSPTVTNVVSSNYLYLPRDDRWHHVYVTGVATNPAIHHVRPVVISGWDLAAGGTIYGDDAELYMGAYTGAVRRLSNGSFEEPGNEWTSVPEGFEHASYSNRTGNGSMHVWAGAPVTGRWAELSQTFHPGTGTYSFAVWLFRQNHFNLTSAELRIEWYDRSLTNKVQADSVQPFLLTNLWWWYEFAVTGTCTHPDLYEVRPVLRAAWDGYDYDDGCVQLWVDDARFLTGAYDGTNLLTDWAYHGGPESTERVPGTNHFGAFLQPDYDTTTTTFFVLSDHPRLATFPEEGSSVGIRIAWYDTNVSDFAVTDTNMTWAEDAVLTAASPFRGLPASGAKTVTVWRFDWPQPHNAFGPVTDPVTVYYAPYLKATNGIIESERKYLVSNGALTNNLGQPLDGWYEWKDYSYVNSRPVIHDALTNGSFETPFGTGFDGTGWDAWGYYSTSYWGCLSRETWAARSGLRGGVYNDWGSGEGRAHQYVAASNGTYTFAMWVLVQPDVNLSHLDLRMDWYDQEHALARADTRDVTGLPRDGCWHHVFVTGTCTQDVKFVGVSLNTTYGEPAGSQTALLFDDATFYRGAYAGVAALANGGLEDRSGTWDWPGSSWNCIPPMDAGHKGGQRIAWAARNGSTGLGLFSFTNIWWYSPPGYLPPGSYQTTLSQNLTPGTGTYVFSIWIKQEENAGLTNAQLRIGWYDDTYTNKVQPDTVRGLSLPLPWGWQQCAVTGTCTEAGLHEVRVSLFAQWRVDEPPMGDQSTLIDDAAFTRVDDSTDGIPNWWWQRYFEGPLTNTAAGDNDDDLFSNLEEYLADTDPTNPLSAFDDVDGLSGGALLNIAVQPTSTARVYDVYWRTNLLPEDSPWWPYGLSVTGNGGAVTLTVTNTTPSRFYRSGVRLP